VTEASSVTSQTSMVMPGKGAATAFRLVPKTR
jgi:hypothetical protein